MGLWGVLGDMPGCLMWIHKHMYTYVYIYMFMPAGISKYCRSHLGNTYDRDFGLGPKLTGPPYFCEMFPVLKDDTTLANIKASTTACCTLYNIT